MLYHLTNGAPLALRDFSDRQQRELAARRPQTLVESTIRTASPFRLSPPDRPDHRGSCCCLRCDLSAGFSGPIRLTYPAGGVAFGDRMPASRGRDQNGSLHGVTQSPWLVAICHLRRLDQACAGSDSRLRRPPRPEPFFPYGIRDPALRHPDRLGGDLHCDRWDSCWWRDLSVRTSAS